MADDENEIIRINQSIDKNTDKISELEGWTENFKEDMAIKLSDLEKHIKRWDKSNVERIEKLEKTVELLHLGLVSEEKRNKQELSELRINTYKGMSELDTEIKELKENINEYRGKSDNGGEKSAISGEVSTAIKRGASDSKPLIKCPKCETIYFHPIEKECNVCGWNPKEKPPSYIDTYRAKPVEERRANYEARITKNGKKLSEVFKEIQSQPGWLMDAGSARQTDDCKHEWYAVTWGELWRCHKCGIERNWKEKGDLTMFKLVDIYDKILVEKADLEKLFKYLDLGNLYDPTIIKLEEKYLEDDKE